MYTISTTTKKNLERAIGLSIEKLRSMSASEEMEWIENKCKSNIKFSKRKRFGIIGRGNPLISRKKIRTKEDLEIKSKRLFGI